MIQRAKVPILLSCFGLCWLLSMHWPAFGEDQLLIITLEPTLSEPKPSDSSDIQLAARLANPVQKTAPTIPQISTSRPSVTDTSTTVPQGSLQSENGATYTHSRIGTKQWTLPETLLRLGVTDNTEFRFNVPNYINVTKDSTAAPTVSGANNFGDIQVGISHHVVVPAQIDVAIIPLLNIPTGAQNVSSQGLDPEFRIAASKNIGKFSLGSQFNTRWSTWKNASAPVTFTPTFIVYYNFIPKFNGFLEWAGTIPTSGRINQIAQSGILYRPTPRQQFDVRVATGLNNISPSILVGFGYSFRIDGFFGKSKAYASFK